MIAQKHKIYLKMARDYSQMSKCRKIKVGCMIVNNGRIVSTGVNGTPKGTCNCTDHFYNYNDEQFAAAHSAWSTEHEVHAEMNALLYAAKSNVEVTSDCILYCTHEPCNNCLKHIAVTGIKQIYYIEKYYNNTADNKYKINITQLEIDEDPSKDMDPKEIELIEQLTKNGSLDSLFDIVNEKLPLNVDPDFFGHIRGKYQLSQPIPIILNGRRIFYEYGTVTLNELIKLCEFPLTEENRKYYRADYRKNTEEEFKDIPSNKCLILQNEMQIRCSGATPV